MKTFQLQFSMKKKKVALNSTWRVYYYYPQKRGYFSFNNVESKLLCQHDNQKIRGSKTYRQNLHSVFCNIWISNPSLVRSLQQTEMNNTKFLQAIKKQNQIIWLESLAQSSSISQILYSRFKFKNKYTKFNKESGICTQIKGKPRWLITKSKGLILNAEVIVLNLSLKMTHEVLVPHKLIRAQKVLFTSPILSKLQCGRWATIVAQSQLQWTI